MKPATISATQNAATTATALSGDLVSSLRALVFAVRVGIGAVCGEIQSSCGGWSGRRGGGRIAERSGRGPAGRIECKVRYEPR